MQDRDPKFQYEIPAGDTRERRVCDHCGFIDYENPRIVVGSIATWEGGILLCRRSIEPRVGYWTLPAGFLEVGETCEEGARREAAEEARAEIEIRSLIGIYNLTRISQIHLFFEARLRSPAIAAGEETTEVRLVEPPAIPWDELAFDSIRWVLQQYCEGKGPRPLFYPELGS